MNRTFLSLLGLTSRVETARARAALAAPQRSEEKSAPSTIEARVKKVSEARTGARGVHLGAVDDTPYRLDAKSLFTLSSWLVAASGSGKSRLLVHIILDALTLTNRGFPSSPPRDTSGRPEALATVAITLSVARTPQNDRDFAQTTAELPRTHARVFHEAGVSTHRVGANAIRRICKRTGVRVIHWHLLRHTFASHLAMEGVPIPVVQQLLGHANITMTMRYAHLFARQLGQAVEVLQTLENREVNRLRQEERGQPVGNNPPEDAFPVRALPIADFRNAA